jgi:very-short-patch-repair endonuclease
MDYNRRPSPEIRMRARELRKTQTKTEEILWRHLRRRQLNGVYFRRQYPIGPFIVDFCCTEHYLIIELDGPSHDDQVEYDEERTEWLEAHNYRVIRFTNEQIRTNLEGVLKTIAACVGVSIEDD